MLTPEQERILKELNKNLSLTKKVLTLQEATDFLTISKSYLYKLVHWGLVRYSKPNGKLLYFDREHLEEWALSNRSKDSESDVIAHVITRPITRMTEQRV
ncbi:helix-turn-helix domain-containing protein [Agriterribacter sp.]|uniref:helix-turn-helix domain-containing protein n=1 Tax=Agriterribacter sp. TaxID=2821509 RepID=UPI002B8998FF|nr:helix-turn-helix domain-containing protein [Agriterribacter sp.]HTN06070.1 helix-turn-helix domain-containing protein [Agriterribacter sp.]